MRRSEEVPADGVDVAIILSTVVGWPVGWKVVLEILWARSARGFPTRRDGLDAGGLGEAFFDALVKVALFCGAG